MALGKNFGDGNNNSNKKTDKKIVEEKENETSEFLESTSNNNSISAIQSAVDIGWSSIEFEPDGTIVEANNNLIKNLGYSNNDELVGKHHAMFCELAYTQSASYTKFWDDLRAGITQTGEYKRIKKDGSEIWLNSTYTAVKNDEGHIYKIIKIASNITDVVIARQRGEALQYAVDTGWSSIEFELDGTIIEVNNNFIKALGYLNSKELEGKHHQVLCEASYVNSVEYKSFWSDLANGIAQDGEFKQIKKDRSEVWINTSYTPVKNNEGVVYKIIGIASNITAMVTARERGVAVQYAVNTGWSSIEFELDGTIIEANDNYIKALGYLNSKELEGNHHQMFFESDYTNSAEYRNFWSDLGNGITQTGEFKLIKKDRSEVWVNASYTPVKNNEGDVYKVIKIASNITAMVTARERGVAVQSAVNTGWLSVEFAPDGSIIEANDNFIDILGYLSNKELEGNHHQMFCESTYINSAGYKNFWSDLANGITQTGEFKVIKKDGSGIWLNASYTPVKDGEGNVFKVITIAADITEIKDVLQKVNEIVSLASSKGDLSQRIDNAGATGDYKLLGDSINSLLNAIGVPMVEMKNLMGSLAEGKLDKEFDLDVEGDIKDLGDAYNDAMTNLNNLMGELTEVATLVASSSEELLTKSDQMQGTTQEVASAIQQMAEGAHEQAQQTDDTSKLVEEVMKSSNNMSDKADLINRAAESGQKSSTEGLVTVRKVVENMEEIQTSADVTSESVDVLSERSEDIARTLNVITDIASQTNLLALNAAIEAARAGEAGRGFAVVAEEIRKLAEDSRKSAVDIQKVITAVQKDITQAAKAIDTMGASVKSGNVASKEAEVVFGSIGKLTSETFNLSQSIQGATTEQKGSIDDTVKNIEKIVVVAEETAAGSEQIATSSKELYQGMEEVNTTSKQLAAAANQLQSGVSKFTLKK
jgi:methyl-accepting chemotaxis protein